MGVGGSLAMLWVLIVVILGDTQSRPPTTTSLQRLFAYSKVAKHRHFLWLAVRHRSVSVRYRHRGYRTRLNTTTEMVRELYQEAAWRSRLPAEGDFPIYGDDFAPKLPRQCAPVLAYCGAPRLSIPAFPFGKWPEARLVPFYQFYAEAAGLSCGFLARRPQLFWRGNVNIHPLRQRLVVQYGHRPEFNMSAVFVGKPSPGAYATMADHARFRYLLDAPAMGYSGRLARLLLLGSVVFIVDRPWHHWEYWHQEFAPWVHYVPVRSDGSDLLQNLRIVMHNDTQAAGIAEACNRQAREVFARQRVFGHFADVLANYTLDYGTLDLGDGADSAVM